MKRIQRSARHPSRLLGVLAVSALLWGVGAPQARAAEVLDQRQELVNSAVAIPGGFNQAQTFTAGIDGFLHRVSVHAGNPMSAVSLTIEIQSVNEAGQPSGTALARQNLALGTPKGAAWLEVAFDNPAAVATGKSYAIVLKPSDSFTWSIGSTAPYPPGKALTGADGWWEERGDYAFRTYVGSGNARPVGAGEAYTLQEDSQLTVGAPGLLGNDSDPDGDNLTVVLVQRPARGTLMLEAGGFFTYTPDRNFYSADSFTYMVSDGSLKSDPVTVALSVSPVNDPPVLAPVAVPAGMVGQSLEFAVPVAHPDGEDALRFSLEGAPVGAVIDPATGRFSWTPSAAQAGEHRFTVSVSDSASPALTDQTEVVLKIAPAPVPLEAFHGKLTGGGWLPTNEGGRASFGFALHAGAGGTADGEARYAFRSADGQEFRIVAGGANNPTFDPKSGAVAFSAGVAVEQVAPATGEVVGTLSGFVMAVQVVDGDQKSPPETDTFAITIVDPSGAVWHRASGQIGGGQVKVHSCDAVSDAPKRMLFEQ